LGDLGGLGLEEGGVTELVGLEGAAARQGSGGADLSADQVIGPGRRVIDMRGPCGAVATDSKSLPCKLQWTSFRLSLANPLWNGQKPCLFVFSHSSSRGSSSAQRAGRSAEVVNEHEEKTTSLSEWESKPASLVPLGQVLWPRLSPLRSSQPSCSLRSHTSACGFRLDRLGVKAARATARVQAGVSSSA